MLSLGDCLSYNSLPISRRDSRFHDAVISDLPIALTPSIWISACPFDVTTLFVSHLELPVIWSHDNGSDFET